MRVYHRAAGRGPEGAPLQRLSRARGCRGERGAEGGVALRQQDVLHAGALPQGRNRRAPCDGLLVVERGLRWGERSMHSTVSI